MSYLVVHLKNARITVILAILATSSSMCFSLIKKYLLMLCNRQCITKELLPVFSKA